MTQEVINKSLEDAVDIIRKAEYASRISADNPVWSCLNSARHYVESQITHSDEIRFAAIRREAEEEAKEPWVKDVERLFDLPKATC